jgi:hypothetical protein
MDDAARQKDLLATPYTPHGLGLGVAQPDSIQALEEYAVRGL